jgi:hypothetical protein
MTWHKAWAQLSQGVAGRPHHLSRLAMCWRIFKNHFVYVSSRGGAQGIQCPKTVQRGNLSAQPSCMAGRPDKWASHTQSSARVPPYSSYKYHHAPLAESVKRVVTPPTTTTRLGGVTTLQDNNKTKALENMGINLKDQSKRKQLPTFNLNQRV